MNCYVNLKDNFGKNLISSLDDVNFCGRNEIFKAGNFNAIDLEAIKIPFCEVTMVQKKQRITCFTTSSHNDVLQSVQTAGHGFFFTKTYFQHVIISAKTNSVELILLLITESKNNLFANTKYIPLRPLNDVCFQSTRLRQVKRLLGNYRLKPQLSCSNASILMNLSRHSSVKLH